MSVYEGREKYIFVSYSHRDDREVIPVVERLQEMGFRIWYDEGIEAGSEWADSVARHLKDCELFVSFISSSYLDSFNCKRETDYAVSKRKPFIAVKLEEAVMPPGMEMQFSGVQFINRYQMNDKEFYTKLAEAELAAKCREVVNPDAPADERTEPEVKKRRRISKRTKWIACIVALVTVAAGIVYYCGSKIMNPVIAGSVHRADEEFVTIENAVLRPEDTKKLSRFMNMHLLELNNCSFVDGSEVNLADIDSGVRSFHLSGCTGIEDYTFLNNLNSIEWLYITNCGFDDEDAGYIRLGGMTGLTGLDLSDNKEFSDISALIDPSRPDIKSLNVSNTAVSDLSTLRDLPGLTTLDVENTDVESLEPLQDLLYLQDVRISGCPVKSLLGLENAYRLATLSAAGCNIGSIDSLGDCTALERVDLSGNKLTDISPLEKSRMNIEYLLLDDNDLSDLSPLSGMRSLVILSIDNNHVEDLSFVEGSNGIRVISARHNRIRSIDPISSLPGITGLYLSDNEIEGDVVFGDTFGIPDESVASVSDENGIRELHLQHNKISSVTFKGKPPFSLSLQDNPLVRLTGSAVPEENREEPEPGRAVFKLANGETIIIDDFVEPELHEGSLTGVAKAFISWQGPSDSMIDLLKNFDQFTDLHISGCPVDCMSEITGFITSVSNETDERMDKYAEEERVKRMEIYMW